MSANKRIGTSLLAFVTNREPDTNRGNDIKHFKLSLPTNIKDEINKWENRERQEFSPCDAAKLLWSTRAAGFLDGRLEAWEEIPGVQLLLPGWKALAEMEPSQNAWPSNQEKLRSIGRITAMRHSKNPTLSV